MKSSPANAVPAAPAGMQEAATASPSRSRDPRLLLGSFDLPSWGCRRTMAFGSTRPLGGLGSPGSSAAAAQAQPPQPKSSRSPPEVAAADVGAAAAAVPEAPRKPQWNLRNMDGGGGCYKKSRGFSVALTKAEIDEDFLLMTGKKAPRKPQRRPKSVQRQINALCPGNSLPDVSRDRYKVNKKGGF